MLCPKCNSPLVEGTSFCSTCGEKVENQTKKNIKFCHSCGQVISDCAPFCSKCGASLNVTAQAHYTSPQNFARTSGKIKGSYFTSAFSAILAFIIRIAAQTTHYSPVNILRNKKMLGLDADIKPFVAAIPIIAAIITTLLIVTDNTASTQKKATALIINALLIILAFLFVYFDIPYKLIDF